jgi:hypothetical protein
MKLVRYVAHMGDWRGIFRDFVGKHKARKQLQDLGIDGSTRLTP